MINQIFKFIISALFGSPILFGVETFPTLEEEYTPTYCSQLEAAYGQGMMSEGGIEGVELMFDEIGLEGKTALDIGSGLGGVAFYLAEQYGCQVTGLEVNPWMVTEAEKRTPKSLKNKVDFFLSTNNNNWPVATESYDLVYSKGVLTHVADKNEIFQEVKRILKKDGKLVITDWLSSDEKKWGENIGRLVELEHLTLYPETVSGYTELLEKNGFILQSVQDESSEYMRYNQQIVDRLEDSSNRTLILKSMTDQERKAAIEGYASIAKALEIGELKVVRFVLTKN